MSRAGIRRTPRPPAARPAPGTMRLELRLAEAAEDRLTGELWGWGTLGTRSRRGAGGYLEMEAWFAGDAARRVAALGPEVWQAAGAELLASSWEEERDWLRHYRRRQRPFAVGRGLWIDPGEPGRGRAAPPPAGRRLLRLPARQAFGTGSHESTALAVELLEALDLGGRRVLDVGCGTGILAFAARLAGAAGVVALDVDPVAAFAASVNRRLNGIGFALLAGRVGALTDLAPFDVALVNVLPARLRLDLPDLARRVRPGGAAIFSGLLEEGAAAAETELAAHGFQTEARRRAGGWAALLTRRERR